MGKSLGTVEYCWMDKIQLWANVKKVTVVDEEEVVSYDHYATINFLLTDTENAPINGRPASRILIGNTSEMLTVPDMLKYLELRDDIINAYVAEQKPDVIVHAGGEADKPRLVVVGAHGDVVNASALPDRADHPPAEALQQRVFRSVDHRLLSSALRHGGRHFEGQREHCESENREDNGGSTERHESDLPEAVDRSPPDRLCDQSIRTLAGRRAAPLFATMLSIAC